MNRITFFLLLLVFPLTFVPQNEENRGYRVKVGDPVPPLTLQMINGEIWTNKAVSYTHLRAHETS